ncbi:hypothetical protein HYPSUDRAFT_49610 [Hypholoma sublateritium FD-334 SS-4]|uniref:ATP-dependent RNA helicase n=1 Tax=Hypholoma sublateritium (strain FD-334 SS-4) TaxID=945553 RepID=A0A0D2N3I4_HYPSF|nr:hypothetical protein HYPSUDRAFT_49610 [Hypholoma sublateritium FD-334 SS-4]
MMKQTTARPPRRRGPYNAAPKASLSTATSAQRQPAAEPRVPTPALTIPVPADTMRFADLGKDKLLHPTLLQTVLEDLKFDHMMPVQAATLHELLEKHIDCLAQAKTGTGKTIAFLLPAIQSLINKKRVPGEAISLLVISPTRELTLQIAKEAEQLLQRLPQYKVCVAIGGTNKNSEERKILAGCDILVATPGRLFDHLSDPRIRGKLQRLDTLVLDEADRLLDMGFMNALKDIIKCLPDRAVVPRQGMLFSATIAPHVEKFAHLVLAPGYKFISTIPAGESNTHEHVPQLLVTVPTFADVAPALVAALRAECTTTGAPQFKAIVFAPTAALADWYAALLAALPLPLPPVSVLHSRVSQSRRTSVTNAFRDATAGVLVATDVVARGMDFPNVTTVIQVGVPMDKESYIHRLGRTARAGRAGRAVLVVAQPESFFPTFTLKEIPFQSYRPASPGVPNTANTAAAGGSATAAAVHAAAAALDADIKTKTYKAWLGYYKSHARAMRWSDADLVAQANAFADAGLHADGVPPVERQTVGKMGLKGVPGLNVVPNEPRAPRVGGGRGGGGGGEGRPVGSGGRGGGGAGAGAGGRAGGGGGGRR